MQWHRSLPFLEWVEVIALKATECNAWGVHAWPAAAFAQGGNAGLMAPMIITAKGGSRPDGSPKDVDREFIIAFYEFLEIESR
jgi:hypothetical protein